MKEQGYELNIEIKEDNRSTMLLMKNGKLSSGKRTKHLDLRYFYVKDLIDRGIVKLSHFLSEHMIADFFTKPIQGQRLQLLRDLIMNINSAAVHRSVLGNRNQMDALMTELTQKTQKESRDRVNDSVQTVQKGIQSRRSKKKICHNFCFIY